MTRSPTFDPAFDSDEVLAHAHRVRALARCLLRSDPAAADDLAQEAWLAALGRTGPPRTSLARWLAGTLRNLARQHGRGEGRRRARELVVARAEGQPGALELGERLALHRQVVEAVEALDEPYRSTVFARFFEERSARSIARDQGVPLATVKTRLARALARLRDDLDRKHGRDGRSWALALLPLTRVPRSTGVFPWSTLLMSTQSKLAVAALVVLGAVLWFRSAAPVHTAAPGARAPLVAADPPSELPATAEVAHAPERVALALAPGAPDAGPRDARAAATLEGRVIDCRGTPMAGLRVWFEAGRVFSSELVLPAGRPASDERFATSDTRGRFRCESPETAGRFLVFEERYTTVLAGLWRPPLASPELVVVVAPRTSYSGRVVSADARPIPAARVVLLLARELRASIDEVLDGSAECGWLVRTDAQGHFVLDNAPGVDGSRLKAFQEGWIGEVVQVPPSATRGIEIVLSRPSAGVAAISGQVFESSGWPSEGALVSLGTSTATTDDRGLFSIGVPAGGTQAPLIAVKRGHLPSFRRPDLRRPETDFVVLHLGAPPLAIEGRVVDAGGEPLEGIQVWVSDPTLFGSLDEIPAHVEGILAGAMTRSDLERMLAALDEDSDPEAAIFRSSTVLWSFEKTDAHGRFRLPGLLEREYRLAAIDPLSLLRVDDGPWRAGARDVEIRFPAASDQRLRGRVVRSSGEPAVGISVAPRCDVIKVHVDAHSWSTVHGQALAAVSDADGRFELARVPRQDVYLALAGESILPLEVGRNEPGGIRALARADGELVVQVESLRRLLVEPSPATALADEIAVLDAVGERLRIHAVQGSARFEADVYPLQEGRADVLFVSERAQTLLLLKQGAEVRRAPLALTADGLNLVRP